MLIDLLDRVLTRLFATKLVIWIAVHVLHIPAEKCSLCYTRVRWAQFMLVCTNHLDRIEWIHGKRVNWRVRVNHARADSSPSSIQVAAYSPLSGIRSTLDEIRASDPRAPLTLDQLPSPNDVHGAEKYLKPVVYPPQPLWWPRTSQEEDEQQLTSGVVIPPDELLSPLDRFEKVVGESRSLRGVVK